MRFNIITWKQYDKYERNRQKNIYKRWARPKRYSSKQGKWTDKHVAALRLRENLQNIQEREPRRILAADWQWWKEYVNLKANDMQSFSNLFDKVLYMFRTDPLSVIRSVSTPHTQ